MKSWLISSLVALFLALPATANAQTSLTPAQLTTLCTNIKAATDGTVTAQLVTGGSPYIIATAYNLASASPIVAVWIPNLTPANLNTAIVGSELVALTPAKAVAFQIILMTGQGTIDATNVNIRADFAAIWASTTTLTNITALAQRTASRFEAVFATGGSPATVPTGLFGYQVSGTDVGAAVFNPNGTVKTTC